MEQEEDQEQQQAGKWAGKATARLTGPRANLVWPFLQDYCHFHRWHSTLDVCQHVGGVAPGQPGCVRYCASTTLSSDGEQKKTLFWAKEKLVAIDPIGRSLSYEIIDGNTGLRGYVATFVVVEDGDGCTIEWSFIAYPVEGWTQEVLVSYLDSRLQAMAKRMEQAAMDQAS